MLFTADAHRGLADGSITVTFRAWKRPQVRVGGRYVVGGTMLEVDALSRVARDEIGEGDAARAGFEDRAALLARLGDGREDVWRVEFHRAGEDPRRVLATRADLTAADRAEIGRRLDRLDRASPHGPWTRQALALIAERPGVVSTELAAALDRDRPSFKADVRKLKALGLTESLEVGYWLSPRGRAFYGERRRQNQSG